MCIKFEEAKGAIHNTRGGTATKPNEISVELWKILGKAGLEWLTGFFKKKFTMTTKREEWRCSIMIPLYKNKGET